MDTRWHIDLFNGLRARQGERVFTQFKTRKAEALLACLLLRPDQPCRRDELAQMLWSKNEGRDALLHRLNTALSELRQFLTGPDLFPPNLSPSLCLDPNMVVTDVGEFKRLLAAAQAGTPDERIHLLRAATALYRGELMPGYCEDWIEAARDELAQKHQEALGGLTQALFADDDFDGALEHARRWVRNAPRDERAHRALMEAYVALGRAPEARSHYKGLERTLQAEQQTPAQKTRELADRIGAAAPPPPSVLPHTPTVAEPARAEPAEDVLPSLEWMPEARPRAPWAASRPRGATLAALWVAALCMAALGGLGAWNASHRGRSALSSARPHTSQRDQAGLLCRQGRSQWNGRTRDSMEAALHSFQDAARTAPDYAPAYAGLADTYGLLGYYGWANPAEAFERDGQNASKAVHWAADAHERAEAYTSLGWADMMDRQWDVAAGDFTKAIAFDPKYSTAHQWYSLCLIIRGDKDDSEAEIGEAAGDDSSSSVIPKSRGQRLYYSGQYDKAVRRCSEALLSHPDDPLTTLWLGLAYEKLGKWEKASFALKEAIRYSGRRDVGMVAALGHCLAVSGDTRGARSALKELQDRRAARRADDYVSPVALALIDAGLFEAGRRPQDEAAALQQLDLADREHAGDLILIGIEPRFAGLASDPQFRRIKKDVNL